MEPPMKSPPNSENSCRQIANRKRVNRITEHLGALSRSRRWPPMTGEARNEADLGFVRAAAEEKKTPKGRKFQTILAGKMCKERRIMCESSNKIRVSPYPLRSTRTNKLKAIESPIETEWEDVRCVICMEPPHDAVLLTCSSSLNGCRPYMCGTSVRHSNCFKQFSRNNRKKHSNTKTLHCPLCRGEVFETKKAAKTTRRFMNAKPRSCPVDDCEFSATYSHLNKHLKTEHRGIVPTKVDPQRQCRWEMMERHAEYVNLMTAAGIPHMSEVVHHQLPNNHHLPMFHVNFNETLQNLIGPSYVSNGFSLVNHASLFIPTLQFRPMDMYRGRTP